MKHHEVRPQTYVRQLSCDRCGRVAERDAVDCEFHEFTSLDFRGGYASIFGDGHQIAIDLCQHCLKETLGPWLQVTNPLDGPLKDFDLAKHGGEFPAEGQEAFVRRGKAALARMAVAEDGVPAEVVIAKLEAKLAEARRAMSQRHTTEPRASVLPPTALPEHAPVVVNKPLPHLGLASGAHGTIVHVHPAGAAYEVELVDADGRTLGVETIEAQWITARTLT